MNNRFKFRAWDTYWRKWKDLGELSYSEMFQDDKYIVQQYTGLKDVNGKEIYEGDIVKTVYEGDKSKEVGVVVFDIDTCSYRIRVLHFSFPIITYRIPENSPATLLQVAKEVIGNILEHPDLISVDDVI